ncbi:hypothetical protein, partial [Hoylesella shahii]|uniref:hypothetical protein n=1 Tax=Hoylesella shahii TaxID=228603 RepID=UPI00288C4A05
LSSESLSLFVIDFVIFSCLIKRYFYMLVCKFNDFEAHSQIFLPFFAYLSTSSLYTAEKADNFIACL